MAPMTTPFEPRTHPEPDTGLGTLVEDRPETAFGDGDHERFAHYVKKDKIVESAVTGTPVIALCGKTWIPGRDPNKFPVCPDCKRILDEVFPSKDDKDGS
jgi:hypothetical protein